MTHLNFVDNLEAGLGSKAWGRDDFYTNSLNEQYEALKPKLGSYAPDTLQQFIAQIFPTVSKEYYVSLPGFDRAIKENRRGKQCIYNLVIRAKKDIYSRTLPDNYDVIIIGDVTFGNVIDISVKGIELIDVDIAKYGEKSVYCTPEVACLTLSKPDRAEREKMMEKIESGFEVKLKPGETLMTCDKKNEYVDMLDDFTNREIIQLARLSRKEGKMPFEQLYLLFKYGEKDNPWEKLDYNAVKKIKKILAERVVGQEEAIEKIEKVVVKAYMGLTGIHKSSSRSAPKGVLFFVGPTGVGKTELSKALAKFLFGDEQACIRFDMSEYAQENSDQKLIGAPPGYVGYEEGGQLTNAVKEKPFSIILFDEIEKAAKPNPRILDIFLQILEDGRLTDSKGETVYFSESVIIFTSNLGASEVSSSGSNEEIAEEFIKIVKNYFDNEIKRPEILGRIGYSNIVPFNFIKDKEFSIKIARSKLRPVQKAIAEKYRIDLEFEDELKFINYILGGADSSKGGRDILNAINDKLLDELYCLVKTRL